MSQSIRFNAILHDFNGVELCETSEKLVVQFREVMAMIRVAGFHEVLWLNARDVAKACNMNVWEHTILA